VVDLTSRLRVGSPRGEHDPFFGPVISPRAAQAVLAAQAALVEGGAVALLASRPGDDGPAYVTPGVLDVTAVVERPDVEIFGPMLQVLRVASVDAAIAEANDTMFGLAAGVVTDDDDLWAVAAPLLDAGIVNRNLPTVGASGAAPFGGVGASGNHRPAGYTAADYCASPVASLTVTPDTAVAPITEVIDA
jgi:succinylglutamic semialdehyde dehydrogenase